MYLNQNHYMQKKIRNAECSAYIHMQSDIINYIKTIENPLKWQLHL